MHGTSKALLVMALACNAGAVAWTATDATIHDAVRLWLDDRAAAESSTDTSRRGRPAA